MSEQASVTGFNSAGGASHARPRRHTFLWLSIAILLAVIAACVYVTRLVGAPPKPVKLALVTWNEDPFWDLVIRGAEDAANQNNAELTVIRSKPDVEVQSAHVRDLLAKGMDGIAISPNNAAAQAALLREAADKVTLITFDTDAPDSNRRAFVSIDNYVAGHLTAEEVRSALPDGGAILISVGSIDMQNGRDRRQGLIDSLLERPFKRDRPVDPIDATLKGPTYSIVGTVVDAGDTAKAQELIAEQLRAHPEVKCVVGLFSYSGPAAVAAIEAAGRAGSVQVIGFDETTETQSGIESGKIFSSILQDQYRCGQETVRLLAEETRGGTDHGPDAPREILVNTVVLRKDNLEAMRETRRIR